MQAGYNYGNYITERVSAAQGHHAEMLMRLMGAQDGVRSKARGLGIPSMPGLTRVCVTKEDAEALLAELELAVEKIFAVMSIAIREEDPERRTMRDMISVVRGMEQAFFLPADEMMSAPFLMPAHEREKMI